VGANVVTGMGVPTAGFVYKLVEIGDPGAGDRRRPVAKRSPGKASFGGRKWAWRALLDQPPARAEAGAPSGVGPVWADVVAGGPEPPLEGARPLQVTAMENGEARQQPSLVECREFHRRVRDEVGTEVPLVLDRQAARGAARER
jgi:nicotinate phosphoribosyltransferase